MGHTSEGGMGQWPNSPLVFNFVIWLTQKFVDNDQFFLLHH